MKKQEKQSEMLFQIQTFNKFGLKNWHFAVPTTGIL